MYTCMYVCMYVCIYIYIYIDTHYTAEGGRLDAGRSGRERRHREVGVLRPPEAVARMLHYTLI